MGILRVDHPDIEEFITAKQNESSLRCFNLSVAVTDKFMEAVEVDGDFDLVFEGRTYRTIRARVLWEKIMRGTWDWAEPGVIFIDRINHWNNLAYCESISATNPCSEQPLPPFGACLLGSFNLTRYLRPAPRPSKLEGRYWFNDAHLIEDVAVVVRAMDNVVDTSMYPLEGQKRQALMTRRMGLGVMGVANAIEAMGYRYGSREFISRLEVILEEVKNAAYMASAYLAAEKGVFPHFQKEEYLKRPFIQGLKEGVREKVELYGVRNSHLTTIAPTGTTAFAMDNVSSGIEPVFSVRERRRVRGPEGEVECDIVDYGTAVLGVEPKTTMDVTAKEHIAVLTAAQRHVDSAISKTCNVPTEMPWDQFKGLYHEAWRGGAKGCATFQTGGMRTGVREAVGAGPDPVAARCASGSCEL
jgi:ribonucleoside-diphosphate reductase alpha chain